MLEITIAKGIFKDYQNLSRFHYLDRRPATVAGVVTARARLSSDKGSDAGEVAGVLVLSYPVPFCWERTEAFGLGAMGLREKLTWANANLRSISRVIVHPRYRGLSIATRLVRAAIEGCGSRYVEAHARLGRAMPFFERAGMRQVAPRDEDDPAYYWAETGVHNLGLARGAFDGR